jgi:TonB family protein
MKPLAHERASSAETTRGTRPERIEAVVVCKDDGLLIELGPILGERYRTHSVDAPAEITANVATARWIGIVDTDSLADARSAITRMETQFHRCPLILISSRPQEWSAAIARGAAVVAVQRQEASGPKLLDALAAAEARLLADVDVETTHGPASSGSARGHTLSGGPLRWWVAAGLCVVLGVGGWWFTHRASPSRAPGSGIGTATAGGGARESSGSAANSSTTGRSAVTPEVPAGAQATTAANGAAGGQSAAGAAEPAAAALPAAKPQSVLELLSAARIAFRDQKLLPRPDGEPRGDSALELYTQVLSQDPGNDEALDGVRRLFLLGKARVQTDLASGKLDDATRLVGLFKDAGVSAAELGQLSASIAAARPKWAQQRVQQALTAGDVKTAEQLIGQLTAEGTDPTTIVQLRHELDARKLDLQLTAMAAQVHSAIVAGDLLQPADNSARTRIAAMRTLARTHPVTLAAERDLTAALISRGQQATRDAQFDQAQRLFAAAAELGSSTALSDARRQLQSAMSATARRRAQAAAAAEAAAAPSPSSSSPAPAPSTAPKAAPPGFIAAHPIRPLDVAYPPNTNAAGSVIVEFTLSPDGTASDMSVVSASPRGVFDQTAMDAVGRGRYSTRGLHGQPVRARILLRFDPN